MCERTQCETCDKPSWVGCGMHVETVLGDVPVEERCQCPSVVDKIKSLFGFGKK